MGRLRRWLAFQAARSRMIDEADRDGLKVTPGRLEQIIVLARIEAGERFPAGRPPGSQDTRGRLLDHRAEQ